MSANKQLTARKNRAVKALRRIKDETNWTLPELAELIGPYSDKAVGHWVSGTAKPTGARLESLENFVQAYEGDKHQPTPKPTPNLAKQVERLDKLCEEVENQEQVLRKAVMDQVAELSVDRLMDLVEHLRQ